MSLTPEQRSAIALKAVATRRARLAGAVVDVFSPVDPSKPKPVRRAQDSGITELPCNPGEVVQYYDDGWYAARVDRVWKNEYSGDNVFVDLLSIPAYGKNPKRFTVNRSDIRAVENSK